MNKNTILSSIFCGLCLASFTVSANDKVETTYNAQKYQQVCKGKSQGSHVSFAYRGIIWNGTCEPQFFATAKNVMIKGDKAELNSICATHPHTKSVNIEGKEISGKCALGFTPPHPK